MRISIVIKVRAAPHDCVRITSSFVEYVINKVTMHAQLLELRRGYDRRDGTFSSWPLAASQNLRITHFRIKTVSWLSSCGGSPFQTPFCMRGVFWQPRSSFVPSTPPKTATLYMRRRSQHSVPNKPMSATYLPRSPTCTQLRPKRRFQRSSLEMRPTQNRSHAELRAFLSPADADCAMSDGRSGWITLRTRNMDWFLCELLVQDFEHVLARYRHTSRGTAG